MQLIDQLVVQSELNAIKNRILIAKMLSSAKSSHIGSAFSVIDILTCLYRYFYCGEAFIPKADILLSKGHAASALYATLYTEGIIEADLEEIFCKDGSEFYGHVNHSASAVIPLSTGSLGHALPMGVGKALGKQKLGRNNEQTIIVMSDGECNEGTTWESALLAAHFKLNRLLVFIDRNNIQSLGGTEETLRLEPLRSKWESFGWECRVIDGHNHFEIFDSLKESDRPVCIIANTIKGKGVGFMENSVAWHYKYPNQEQLIDALSQIKASRIK
jgi:transketolase